MCILVALLQSACQPMRQHVSPHPRPSHTHAPPTPTPLPHSRASRTTRLVGCPLTLTRPVQAIAATHPSSPRCSVPRLGRRRDPSQTRPPRGACRVLLSLHESRPSGCLLWCEGVAENGNSGGAWQRWWRVAAVGAGSARSLVTGWVGCARSVGGRSDRADLTEFGNVQHVCIYHGRPLWLLSSHPFH